MGIIYDFQIAMEAEDITKEVEDEKNKLGNKKSKDSIKDASKERDITKTTNIFKEEDDKNDLNITDDPPDKETIDASEDTLDDDSDNELDIDEENDESNNEIELKEKLRENMVLFHGIISNNIQILSDYLPEISNNESNETTFKILKHLQDCKDILFNILTTSLKITPYAVLLKKYIAIQRVYDICIDMLQRQTDITNTNNSVNIKKYKELKLNKKENNDTQKINKK